MKFILWPTSIPEIAALSDNQRKEAWRNAQGHMYRHWETWAGLLAVGLLAVAGRHIGAGVAGDGLGPEIIGAMVGAAVGSLLYSRVTAYVVFRYHSHGQRTGAGA